MITREDEEGSKLTTSSRAALRPNEQVSSVRQLMKEVKRSLGSAVKILRGNMVIRLEMILEMPTASESSISILRMRIINFMSYKYAADSSLKP